MFPIRPLGHFLRQLSTYSRTAPITWLDDQRVCACRYPRAAEFEALVAHDVSLLVNLHVRPHASATLERYALTELHLPVRDFGCPTAAQLDTGITAIAKTVASGRWAAVHCGGGLGRTGTLLACYLVGRGLSAEEALARLRLARPGSVETPQQEAAVFAYARRPAGQ